MLKTEVNVPEVKEMFKEIMEQPEKMFDMLRIDLKESCERAVSAMIRAELTDFLGREKYTRQDKQIQCRNYRNGSYTRNYTVKKLGTLSINIARDRKGLFKSKLIDKYDRYEKVLEKDIMSYRQVLWMKK